MNKTFAELKNGDRFTVNDKEYIKVTEVRISCCHKINAHTVSNPNERVFFQNTQTVTVNA